MEEIQLDSSPEREGRKTHAQRRDSGTEDRAWDVRSYVKYVREGMD